jgi:WD40 repeat protein
VLPQIAGYSDFKEIGHGGMGTVYEAVQRSLNRKVAVKILNPGLSNDKTIVKRFQNEIRILARLDRHPNIVQVLNCGINKQGQLYYIMELVTGKNGDTQTLRELISPQKKVASFINEKQTADLVLQIAEALKYAHENHIIHRDLKPENILIDDRFDQLHAKVTDFGIAAWRTPERTELTSATASFGTWAYMPPEQHHSASNIDHRADIYSLGVMIYEMLTGKLPLGVFVPASKVNPSLNSRWDELIIKMLQQDPRDRPQSMNEVIDNVKTIHAKKSEVAEFSLEQTVEFFIRGLIYPFIFVFSNKKALAILGIVTLVCLIIFAGMLNRNDKKDSDSPDTGVSAEEKIPEFIKLEGHDGKTLTSVAFSPDGKTMIATVNQDDTARIWDVVTGKELKELRHTSGVNSAMFSPDGKMVVMAGNDNSAWIWDMATGIEIIQLAGHISRVTSAMFSHDNKMVVTASQDDTARIWDVATGKELKKLEHPNSVGSAVFSPDDTIVVTVSYGDDIARIWDAATGKELHKLEGHADPVLSAVFSHDGKMVVTASRDRTVRIWDAATGKVLKKLKRHTSDLTSAMFSPDGKMVVTVSNAKIVRIWEVATGKELHKFEVPTINYIQSAVFSHDGKTVITLSDNIIRFWKCNTLPPVIYDAATDYVPEYIKLKGHTDNVNSAEFSPDGKTVVTASDDKTARIWDAVTGKELKKLEHSNSRRSAVFSPDGTMIVTTSYNTARIWDVTTGKELHKFGVPTIDYIQSAVFSPDGKIVVTVCHNKIAWIWDAATGKELKKLEGHTNSAVFSPDGTMIVTESDDKTARIWDVATGKELKKLKGHTESVFSAAFSPDSKLIVTVSFDDTVRIWIRQREKN